MNPVVPFLWPYPMTSVEISGETGWQRMCDFLTPSDPHSSGSWDKCQNPYPLRKWNSLKVHNSQLGNHWGSRNHSACSLVVPVPRRLPCWKLGNFSIGMGSCNVIAGMVGGWRILPHPREHLTMYTVLKSENPCIEATNMKTSNAGTNISMFQSEIL